MPRFDRLLLPLATAALLMAGTAHAEARRSAQSMPAPIRFSPPPPIKMEPARGGSQQRSESGGRGDRGKFDSRRYDHDRDDYERGKEREGHKFEHHHGHGDSPGC